MNQLVLKAPLPSELLEFFRTSLPAAGYLIVDDLGEILSFSGKGWTGTVSSTGTDTYISYKQSSSSTSAAPATGSDIAADPELIDVDGRSIVLPPGISFPENTKIKASSDGYVTLSAPAPAALLDYFRTSLPGAGYLIVDDLGEVLNFSGKGWFGTVATTTDETTISFNL